MSGGVAPSSPVSAANTNQAFLEKNADDVTVGVVGLNNSANPNSGSPVTNTQGELNGLDLYVGRTLNALPTVLPSWTNNDVGTSVDPLQPRVDAITQRFNGSAGHVHSGTSGDAPPIPYLTGIIGPQLIGYLVQGTNLTGVTGSSTDVSTQLTGKDVSTGITFEGIVTNSGPNIALLFGTDGKQIIDPGGHAVYGRVTNSGGPTGTWTLSYFTNPGTETAFTFASATDLQWRYQQLFDETNRPVYSDQVVLTSDQLSGEIPDATTSVKGKVLLATAAPADVGAAAVTGTGPGVAMQDHVHKGIRSIAGPDATQLFQDIVFAGSITRSGNTLTFAGTSLTTTPPLPVGPTTALGTSTLAAKGDHVHEGTHSVAGFLGDVTVEQGDNILVSNDTNGVIISSPGAKRLPTGAVGSSETINDNQSSPAALITIATSAAKCFKVLCAVLRGSGIAQTKEFFVASDGTDLSVSDGPGTTLGDTGVTFTWAIVGSNYVMSYTSTNTGTPGTFYAEATLLL